MSFRIWIPLTVLPLAALLYWVTPEAADIRLITFQEALGLLGTLLVIALFLERALEVFVAALRGPDRDKMLGALKFLEEDVQELKAIEKPSAEQKTLLGTKLAERDLQRTTVAEYRAGTKARAIQAGAVMGLLISAVGFRALEQLFGADAHAGMPPGQEFCFKLVDVILTGGLIGGGSEGIHKIMRVITSFMDKANEGLKQPPRGP